MARLRQEAVVARLVQELPRQLCELGGISQPQPYAHSYAPGAGQTEAPQQCVPQLILEHRAIEFATKVFQRRTLRSARSTRAAPRLTNLKHEIFQLHRRERQRELHRPALPRW